MTPRNDLAVVLCTYNGAAHVREQIRSIVLQTVLPSSLRVFDDGSTDDTLTRIRQEFALRPAAAATVELVVVEADGVQHGAVGNFARGLRSAQEEFVALADQDDVWRPDRLARAMAVLDASSDVALVASNATFIDAEGRASGRTVFEAQHVEQWELDAMAARNALPVLARRNVLPGMTFTLRRELVAQVGEAPPGTMHDYWLALSAAATNSLAIIPEPLVDYRIHGANAVGLDTGRRSMHERARARLRLIRSPLTDLRQWTALQDRLRRDDPHGHGPLVADKVRFERRRRFAGQRGPRRLIALLSLVRSGGYRRFDVGGARGAVKDYLRPPAQDPPAAASTRGSQSAG